MKLHLRLTWSKKPYWKARFSPLALATHSSSRFIFFGILLSPLSPEYDMAVGLASQLCAHMIQAHSNRHMANTIKEHFRHSTDANQPKDQMLMDALLPILGPGILSGGIYDIFNCLHSPFRMTFPTCCFQSQIGRERKEERFGFTITVQSYPGALITWNRNGHILAFYAIFHSEQFWGHVFHKYPPL